MATDRPPSSEYTHLIATIRALRAAQGGEQEIAEQRRAMDAFGASVPPYGITIAEVGSIGGVQCWTVHLAAVANKPRLLFLHGGAYVKGSFRSHRPFLERLATATGAAVVCAEYGLAPEKPFPAALDDAVAVLDELAGTGPVSLVGDSAGGGLALAAAMRRPDAVDRLAVLSPWVDLTCAFDSHERNRAADPILDRPFLEAAAALYAGDRDRRAWELSPLFGPLDRLPPTLVQVAEEELLLDEAVALAGRARALGANVVLTRYADALHVPPLFDIPSGLAAFDELVQFLTLLEVNA